jgi:tRNA threonylcarbamoyladenosine biosynthesis protein TsaB
MLLAIDTSTQWIGLALYDGDQVVGEFCWRSQHHHTVELVPALSNLLIRCGVKIEDLKAIGVALGPGSFTALRIGLAVGKGLALALHLPIIGVPTLDALAHAQPLSDLPMAGVLQAGRNRLAVGWYRAAAGAWQAAGEISILTIEALSSQIRKPTLVCGELSGEERQILARKRKNVQLATPVNSSRRPSHLAELCWERWQAGKVDEVVSLSPIYLNLVEPARA